MGEEGSQRLARGDTSSELKEMRKGSALSDRSDRSMQGVRGMRGSGGLHTGRARLVRAAGSYPWCRPDRALARGWRAPLWLYVQRLASRCTYRPGACACPSMPIGCDLPIIVLDTGLWSLSGGVVFTRTDGTTMERGDAYRRNRLHAEGKGGEGKSVEGVARTGERRREDTYYTHAHVYTRT